LNTAGAAVPLDEELEELLELDELLELLDDELLELLVAGAT
jgi:hypothetical protein